MKLIQKKHVVYCLIGIPLLFFLLVILLDYVLPRDSTFQGWFRLIGWILRLASSMGGIIYAYFTYERLENKYNLFLLPLCILFSSIIILLMIDHTFGYGDTMLFAVYGDTLLFSVPAFVLTFIVAVYIEVGKTFKRKRK